MFHKFQTIVMLFEFLRLYFFFCAEIRILLMSIENSTAGHEVLTSITTQTTAEYTTTCYWITYQNYCYMLLHYIQLILSTTLLHSTPSWNPALCYTILSTHDKSCYILLKQSLDRYHSLTSSLQFSFVRGTFLQVSATNLISSIISAAITDNCLSIPL